MNRLAGLFIVLSCVFTISFSAVPGKIHLASLFSDNMVLQQQRLVPVWGTGDPGAKVIVTATWGASAETNVDSSGKWMIRMQTPKAGGPYVMQVRMGDTLLQYQNVMTGEVWLCSGQSNMEMPLQGWPPNTFVEHSAEEISAATNGNIRLVSVPRASSLTPLSTFEGRWVECNPKTIPGFSAVAYFFGKALFAKLHVPIGLIFSSWGGTPAEAWTGMDTLARFSEFDTVLSKIVATRARLGEFDRWLSQFRVIDMRANTSPTRWVGLKFDDDSCARPDFPDSLWHTMQLPRLWETTEVGNFDGVVWFRRTVEIPKAWVGKSLTLELGPIDDMDITYVNGSRVGAYETEGFYSQDRVYTVPDSLVRDSLVCIAVRVLDYQGGGGIWGNGKRLCLRSTVPDSIIPLEGSWRYLPVADLVSGKLYVLGDQDLKYFTRPMLPIEVSSQTPSSLYQGMILPLVPYSLRGVIWYQGESNVSNPDQYARLFPAMIRNWRDVFHEPDLPFYYVQIAPFAYGGRSHSELLREAQLKTLSLKNTGMAVTMDIGDPNNIHPADKIDVGDRLARWALAKTYGLKIEPSGPLPTKVSRTRRFVVIRFDHAGKGLVLKDTTNGTGFTIAGADSVFHPASVRLSKQSIRVFAPSVSNPLAVRYAFTDTSHATLFNKDGLPAPSFRTDGWEMAKSK